MPSQAALSKAGTSAGQPNTPAKRAVLVMPIIGANSTMWSGRASALSSSASSAYFMASAPPLEKPMTCSGVGAGDNLRASRTARCVAAIHCSHSTLARPAGTVPWPGRRMATAT